MPQPPAADRIQRARRLDRLEARLFSKRTQRVLLGRYQVGERIGVGGFGLVYRAHDPDLDREVAIKFLRSRDTAGATNLVAEARAVAQLQHPNVVSVFDVGRFSREEAADDRNGADVFIVLELVHGPPLLSWIEATQPDTTTLLQVLLGAAAGLAAAHAASIIHRDFKPSNVVVPADGRARVLDFGLASFAKRVPTTGQAEAPSGFVAGTPAYMSPEAHRGDPITPATDQYAFAVAFAEAWCGANPFATMTLSAIARAKAGPLDAHWLRQHGAPKHLVRVLQRATHPCAEHRYASMSALSDELRAAAVPRSSKRATVLAAATIAALAGGAVGLWPERDRSCALDPGIAPRVWSPDRRVRVLEAWSGSEQPFAQQAGDRFVTRVDGLVRRWETARETACAARESAPSEFEHVTLCLRRRIGELETLLELVEGGGSAVLPRALRVVAVARDPGRCRDPEARIGDVPAPPGPGRPLVDAAQLEIGTARALMTAGAYARAQAASQRAWANALASGQPHAIADAEFWVGVALVAAGDRSAGATRLESAYLRAEQLRADGLAARAAVRLVSVYGYHLADPQEANTWTRRAEAAIERDGGAPHEAAALAYNLGLTAMSRGEPAVAQARFTEALAAYDAEGDEDNTATSLISLGAALRDAGDPERSLHVLAQAERALSRIVSDEHPDVAVILVNRSTTLRKLGRVDEARAALQRALAIQRAALGPGHPAVGSTLENMAGLEHEAGRYEGALRRHDEALEILREALGGDHPTVATVLDNRGVALTRLGRAEEALTGHRHAIEIRRKALGRVHPLVAAGHVNLAGAYLEEGRLTAASQELAHATEALAGREALMVEATLLTHEGMLRQRDPARGDPLPPLRRAWAQASASDTASSAKARSALALGTALARAGDREGARARLADAARAFDALGNADAARDARRERTRLAR